MGELEMHCKALDNVKPFSFRPILFFFVIFRKMRTNPGPWAGIFFLDFLFIENLAIFSPKN
jgi:hypothetical protein